MTDLLLLMAVLGACAALGTLVLRALGATPVDAGDRPLVATACGLGAAGAVGLGLAAAGWLRPAPIAALGLVSLAAGGRDTLRALLALRPPRTLAGRAALVLGAVVVLAAMAPAFAPAVGGDQTKYQLAYPRLYAAAGGLVPTPWTFWGQQQFFENFVFALACALHGDTLARLVNVATGALVALAVARLVRRHLAPSAGAAAGALVVTLPMTWSLMTRAGSDLALVLFAVLATEALLDFARTGASEDCRRAGLLAGFAGGSKVMGLLVPALVGLGVLVVLARRRWPMGRAVGAALAFGTLVVVVASPCYVRNAVETGNPLYPFGHGLFPGRNWSSEAGAYLDRYYSEYQTRHAARRGGEPYHGLDLARLPWDLTMHPASFENAPRQAYDVSPFALAFVPAIVLVGRRRAAAMAVAAIGVGFVAIIAAGAWAHPRYVLPGTVLALAAAVPAARALCGSRLLFGALVATTVAGNVAVAAQMLPQMWADQVRVAVGALAPEAFLTRHSPRWVFWSAANRVIPPEGRVAVLEKIPHPYYIERPFVLLSYLEQGLIDYRRTDDVEALAERVRGLGATFVAVDVEGLGAAGDPYEARVTALWRGLVGRAGHPVVEAGGFALYPLDAAPAGRSS